MSERDLVQELKANIVDLQSEKADMARTIETKERRIKQIMIKLEHATKDTQSVGHKISEQNKQIVDLEAKLETTPGQLVRACVELAKDWRTDKYLQKLEAMLLVSDGRELFVITGAGDVLEPEHNVAAIGSGGNFALAAARAQMDTNKSAEEVARTAMAIASDICVYTNGNLTVETIKG